jgi:hypothetical protein
LWAEYLKRSERRAEMFFEVAEANKLSLKNFMCAKNSESEEIKRIQDFQNKSANKFGFNQNDDQIEIMKLEELQSAYREICNGTDESKALNQRVSLVIAETTFYMLFYIKNRSNLESFLQQQQLLQ